MIDTRDPGAIARPTLRVHNCYFYYFENGELAALLPGPAAESTSTQTNLLYCGVYFLWPGGGEFGLGLAILCTLPSLGHIYPSCWFGNVLFMTSGS